mgnify:FL=1
MKTDIKKLYYSIGEVSKIVKLKSYVLRYWETEFKQLSPPKNRAGNRTYRQKDIDIILEIKDLLYNKKFTIEGARTLIGSKKTSKDTSFQKDYLMKIKLELQKIKRIINE